MGGPSSLQSLGILVAHVCGGDDEEGVRLESQGPVKRLSFTCFTV